MSAENLNKRGNPCGLCDKHHGAGPCPHTLAALTAAEKELERLREDLAGANESIDNLLVCVNKDNELAASEEKERQLKEALEQIEQLDRMGHNSEVAAEMGYIARVALDSTQTHGGSDGS